ncbi:hypothetical protein ACX4MU_08915, partial [Roseomonas mucosa]
MTEAEQGSVLIASGGPCGLMLVIELGCRGIHTVPCWWRAAFVRLGARLWRARWSVSGIQALRAVTMRRCRSS